MAQISLDRVISVSILAALKGLANANTSALAIITDEVPISASYGDYGVYYGPDAVATDFGSSSDVYGQAVTIFSQNPNILSAGGFLVIIPRNQSASATAATILASGPVNLTKLAATDYKIHLTIDGGTGADVTIGAIDASSIEAAQTSLNSAALTTAGAQFVLSGSITSATVLLKSSTTGASSALVVGSVSAGTDLATALGISGSADGAAAGLETIKDCILRVYPEVYFFGLLTNVIPTDTELPAIAALIQAIDKMFFFAEYDSAKIDGIITTLKNSGFTNTRAVPRIDTAAKALNYAASYASRGLSTVFTGTDTVSTMHLKDLVGVDADPGMTETLLTACQNAGADVYVNFGVPKVFTSGANGYFDAVYIGLALKLALRTAGFNYLAQTNTKIPQTEIGMNGLKGAYRKVIKQFVTAGAFAPGAWNGTTFGDPADFVRNIADNGFYIFSQPIASQTQTVRASRAAPLVQIACKSAGAIHSSNVLVFIEP